MDLQPVLLESLRGFSKSLDEQVHTLATTGNEQLAKLALDATKQLFDLGVSLEEPSHSQIHPFLAAIAQPSGIQLRSSTKGKEPSPPPRLDPEQVLPHTPLSELTTSGLEPSQIWEQLELRAPGYIKVAKEIMSAEAEPSMEEMEEELAEDDSEDSMTEEDFRQMLEEGELGDLTDEQIEEMMAKAEAESDSGSEDEDEDDDDEDLGDDESGDEEDEVMFEDGTMIGGSDDEEMLDLEEDDEEEEEEDDEEDGDDDEEMMEGSDLEEGSEAEASAGEDEEEAGPEQAGPSRRRRHPTLDDEFFSIDDFNRMTEEAEASKVGGNLNDDEDEDLDEDVGQMMLNGADEDDPIMYGDFFDAPRTIEKPPAGSKGKGKAKINEKPKSKGKGKGKAVKFDEEELDEEDEDEVEDLTRDVRGRVTDDLFADDDEDEEMDDQPLSKFEKQQKALQDVIAEYEQQAVGPKDWTLLGEASARARPENSLLEEDLDFEHVRKVTPVITEESVKTLEDLIKKRILDADFNSTVRVRAYEPTPFLASRYLELQDTQSTKSLAQVYEDEYQAAASGGKAVDPRDVKLKKGHEEIEELWSEICYKLDALSSLNFVPKQPKAKITTISNLPTTSMETALPATSSATTMLAPEELLEPATQSSLVARSELTPEEAQRLREKRRKAKKQDRKHLGDMAELYSKKGKGGTKGEKERALEGLVKSGKGVTVVGKTEKGGDKGKGRKRDGDDASREDGKRLKL